MRGKSPYDDLAEYYDLFNDEVPDDIPFYLRFVSPKDNVLEVGVGTGRVIFALAEAVKGATFVGIDNSFAMLRIARNKARMRGVGNHVRLRGMDMRNLKFSGRYNLVLVPFLGFQFLMTPEDQLKTLTGIWQCLRDGGRCIVHLFHPDPNLIAMRGWSEELRQTAFDTVKQRSVYWLTRSRKDRIRQTIFYEVIYRYDYPQNHKGELRSKQEMRYLFRYEMEHLAARAGFLTEAVLGTFSGKRLTTDCKDMIFVLRKKG